MEQHRSFFRQTKASTMATDAPSNRSYLERQVSEPVLIVGGREFDITNLFPGGKAPLVPAKEPVRLRRIKSCRPASREPSLYPRNSNLLEDNTEHELFRSTSDRRTGRANTQTFRREEARQEESLYPQKYLVSACPDSESATEIFRGLSRHKSLSGEALACSQSSQSPTSKPPPLKWSESGLEKELTTPKPTPKMLSKSFPNEKKNRPEAPHFFKQSSPGSYSLANSSIHSNKERSPEQPNSSDEHDDVAWRGERPLPKLEVAPGVFMELRGARETLRTIESGLNANVPCVCCQVRLLCVPDAEGVICPDCRVVSWVVEARKSSRGPIKRRGVGLGLKNNPAN
jgi:hypothetical protein